MSKCLFLSRHPSLAFGCLLVVEAPTVHPASSCSQRWGWVPGAFIVVPLPLSFGVVVVPVPFVVLLVPLSSIVLSSCPGPCHPAIVLIVVGIPHCLGPLCLGFLVPSSSPPSSPVVLLLLVVLVLVSVPLSFSPSLIIVIPVSSPGPLSTLQAEARSGGVGVSSCHHLVVASQLFSLPFLSASSLSSWLLALSSLSPLSRVLSPSFPWWWWQLL